MSSSGKAVFGRANRAQCRFDMYMYAKHSLATDSIASFALFSFHVENHAALDASTMYVLDRKATILLVSEASSSHQSTELIAAPLFLHDSKTDSMVDLESSHHNNLMDLFHSLKVLLSSLC
jgi:hypothetical protein